MQDETVDIEIGGQTLTIKGIQGDKGEKGDQGIQGEQGKDGKDGTNGEKGDKSEDGKDSVINLEDFLKEIKDKKLIEMRDIKNMPLNMSDMRWHGGGISNITGLTQQGTGITITGDGTSSNPYIINATATSQSLAQTLVIGNTTGGTDIVVSTGDQIIGQTDLLLSAAGGDNYYYAGPNYLFQQWYDGVSQTDFLLQGGGTQLFSSTAIDIQCDTGLYNFYGGVSPSGTLDFSGITGAQTYTFQDASGTLAFLSDIPAGTPSALTKTDDTNVTLTLGGSPTVALLAATSLTLGWTGALSVARGGTGAITLVAAGIPQVVASNDLLAQNASVASVTTTTVPNDGSPHTYSIGAYAIVTAISAGTVTVAVDYTDENNAAQTATFFGEGLTSAGLSGAGATGFPPLTLRCRQNTSITLKATFVGVSVTYDIGGYIMRIN